MSERGEKPSSLLGKKKSMRGCGETAVFIIRENLIKAIMGFLLESIDIVLDHALYWCSGIKEV